MAADSKFVPGTPSWQQIPLKKLQGDVSIALQADRTR